MPATKKRKRTQYDCDRLDEYSLRTQDTKAFKSALKRCQNRAKCSLNNVPVYSAAQVRAANDNQLINMAKNIDNALVHHVSISTHNCLGKVFEPDTDGRRMNMKYIGAMRWIVQKCQRAEEVDIDVAVRNHFKQRGHAAKHHVLVADGMDRCGLGFVDIPPQEELTDTSYNLYLMLASDVLTRLNANGPKVFRKHFQTTRDYLSQMSSAERAQLLTNIAGIFKYSKKKTPTQCFQEIANICKMSVLEHEERKAKKKGAKKKGAKKKGTKNKGAKKKGAKVASPEAIAAMAALLSPK